MASHPWYQMIEMIHYQNVHNNKENEKFMNCNYTLCVRRCIVFTLLLHLCISY